MIRVPLSHFLEIYLSALLLGVLLLWLGSNWRRRWRGVRAHRRVVECSICHHIFADPTREKLPRCPNCGRLNERRPYNDL